MSQLGYADPQVVPPGLDPVGGSVEGDDADAARRARTAAAVPLVISVAAYWIFFIAYWIPETSSFPAHQWWLTQLSPLASAGLTSRGQAQVPVQDLQTGVTGVLLLVCGATLLWLSRTRRWWGRAAMLVPAALGALVVLVSLAALAVSATLPDCGVAALAMLGWVGAAGYATAHAHVGERVPVERTWRSGLGLLIAYALVGPAPTAMGRALFGPSLRDAAAQLEGNTADLRLAALWTPATVLLYLSGLLVGVTVWLAWRWWPPRRRLSSAWLGLGVATSLLLTGWVGWPANTLAVQRTTTLTYASPAEAKDYPCGSQRLTPDPVADPAPARTVAASGFTCRTVTVFAGYRQLGTRMLAGSLSPLETETPEGAPITGRLVAAQYDDVWVAATTGRLDRRADQLVALRVSDGTELWTYTCTSRDALAVRFARVPTGDQPELGRVTLADRRPQVVLRCDGHTLTFDPRAGPGR